MEVHTKKSRRKALIGVARELSRAENVEQLLDQILECSREVMACEVCSILLPEPQSGDMLIRSTLDPPDAEPVRVPAGKGIAGAVFESKEPLNIDDVSQDPRHFAKAGEESGLKTRTLLTVPLLDGDAVLGVMQAINPNERERFDDEDVAMFETFGSLIAVTLIRLEAHKNAIREAETRQQLQLANEIQQSFLPPPHASVGGIRINAFYQPASEIGGDFYFWHALDDGSVLLGIGDVCGKGFPAALDMARGSTLIASHVHQLNRSSLGDWVSKLNANLCDVMSSGRFIALSFARIDERNRKVDLCVCGSLGPKFLIDGAWSDAPHQPNPPLGISCAISYRSTSLPLGLSRHWLLMTDGILEAESEGGERFEDRAFDETLASIAGDNSGNVLDRLTAAWRAFSKPDGYQDDTTLLSFESALESPASVLDLSCEPATLKQARDFVDGWAAFAGFDDRDAGLIVLACDEVLTNICKYAYPETSEGPARLEISLKPDFFEIAIEHRGEGISNEQLPEPTTGPPGIGGMGLGVIRDVFDETDFRAGEFSRIRLRKNILEA